MHHSGDSLAFGRRVSIIGNSCGGKTWLSRRLSKSRDIPVFHTDSLQFDRDLQIKPRQDTIDKLKMIQAQSAWIIDGFGPLDILIERFDLAEEIVFIDLPLWHHYVWCIQRQITNVWRPRSELPPGAKEVSWTHTKKLFRTIWQQHTKMRPELLRILSRDAYKGRVKIIKSRGQLNAFI